jgi:hypothetical protein
MSSARLGRAAAGLVAVTGVNVSWAAKESQSPMLCSPMMRGSLEAVRGEVV